MKVKIIDRKSKAIMYQGEPKTTEEFAELNKKYPVGKYKRFIGVEEARRDKVE